MKNIKEIYEELSKINICELKEFYKMYVPIFTISTNDMLEGNLFNDLSNNLLEAGMNNYKDIVQEIITTVPMTNRVDSYNINILNTNLLGGLLVSLLIIERPIYMVDSANFKLNKHKKMILSEFYNIDDSVGKSFVSVIDLKTINRRSPFPPIFHVMESLFTYMKDLPEMNLSIESSWDEDVVMVMVDLMVADILYGDGALYIIKETYLNDEEFIDYDHSKFNDIFESIEQYFEDNHKGKYNKPDMIID